MTIIDATTYRQPRQEFWADRTVTVAEVRRMIEQLDPVEDDAEITHLSLEVRVPAILGHAAYASGTARGMSHPAEAAVGYRKGRGQQLHDPIGRDRSTLTYFGLFMREGHRSASVQAILDRVQQIHHDVRGVTNHTQLHVLALLILEPLRVVTDLGAPDFFSEKENLARFHFWRGVGLGMGLTGVWETYEEVGTWLEDFETKYATPTEAAHQVYRGQIRGFAMWFPGPLRNRIARSVLTAVLSERTREIVAAGPVDIKGRLAAQALLRSVVLTERVRRVNLSTTWVSQFSPDGEHPDIGALGYQHDRTTDARYLKVGAPEDGYRYTVKDGLTSAKGA